MFTFQKRIVFVRHGRTEWNDLLLYQGKSDIPLNPEGEHEARKVAIRLSGYSPEIVYTSPLKRALQTARIICDALPETPQVEVHAELSEIGFGEWEGRSIKDLESESSDLYLKWRSDPTAVVPPDGETFEDISRRVDLSLQRILSTDFTKILVVSHGGIIRTALASLIGMNPAILWSLRLNNCAISVIDIWSHVNTLVLWNDHTHLFLQESDIPILPLPL